MRLFLGPGEEPAGERGGATQLLDPAQLGLRGLHLLVRAGHAGPVGGQRRGDRPLLERSAGPPHLGLRHLEQRGDERPVARADRVDAGRVGELVAALARLAGGEVGGPGLGQALVALGPQRLLLAAQVGGRAAVEQRGQLARRSGLAVGRSRRCVARLTARADGDVGGQVGHGRGRSASATAPRAGRAARQPSRAATSASGSPVGSNPAAPAAERSRATASRRATTTSAAVSSAAMRAASARSSSARRALVPPACVSYRANCSSGEPSSRIPRSRRAARSSSPVRATAAASRERSASCQADC